MKQQLREWVGPVGYAAACGVAVWGYNRMNLLDWGIVIFAVLILCVCVTLRFSWGGR